MNEPSASQPFPLPPYGDQRIQAPPFAPSHAGAPTAVQPGFGPTQHFGYAVPPPPPQAPPPAQRKRRPVLTTLGVVFGGLLAWGIFGDHEPDRYPSTTPTTSAPTSTPQTGFSEAGAVSVFDLQAGDCYNTEVRPPTDGFTTPISTVDAVPCTSPHTHQVVAKIAYQSSDNYVDVRDKRVHTDCAVALAEKVEKKILADDTYGQMFLLPADITAWKQWPAAACVVTTEQPTTGSLLKS